jgi:hypothetical protein
MSIGLSVPDPWRKRGFTPATLSNYHPPKADIRIHNNRYDTEGFQRLITDPSRCCHGLRYRWIDGESLNGPLDEKV